MKKLPVYSISDFEKNATSFYVHTFQDHVQEHTFVNVAHKHDFYLCVYFTKGSGVHEIDFVKYKIVPGSIFVLKPGQFHQWKVSEDTEGYIFFHNQDFFDLHYVSKKLNFFPFYKIGHSQNDFIISEDSESLIKILFKKMLSSFSSSDPLDLPIFPPAVDLIYCELAKQSQPIIKRVNYSTSYLQKIEKFQELIELNYKTIKSPRTYAGLMNITERHLNKITKETLGKTVKDLIAESIIINAKRKLMDNDLSVAQVAEELGYTDISYFTRLFKKHCKITPKDFRSQQFSQ